MKIMMKMTTCMMMTHNSLALQQRVCSWALFFASVISVNLFLLSAEQFALSSSFSVNKLHARILHHYSQYFF